jgi:YYY domain-containing protein
MGELYISDVAGRLRLGQPPEVGWPPPGPLAAEEAFSVYDHPPVWIFAKADRYSPERAKRVLGEVDLRNAVTLNPGEATRAPNGLLLDPETARIQQENGTYASLFSVEGPLAQRPWLAAVVWWVSLMLLGWLVLPLAYVIFPGLPDRGYPLARVLALLLLSYPAWLLASLKLLPFSRGVLLGMLLVLGALNLFFAYRHRRDLRLFVRRRVTSLFFIELLALGLYLLFIGIRLGNPDVWDVIWGGEKPMDLSYFNAVLKSSYFPPYDPWHAGGYINYYYYGFVLVGGLTKLLGILPTIAYNLTLATLFSLTGLGVFSGAYNLVARRTDPSTWQASPEFQSPSHRPWIVGQRAVVAGLVAMVGAVLLGNLAQIRVVLSAWYRAGDIQSATGIGVLDALVRTVDGALDLALTDRAAPIYTGDWFWSASRAIQVPPGEVQPITEFPFFTFLYGDLHAHVIALPLTLLALGWAISLGLRPVSEQEAVRQATWPTTSLLWLGGALAIGALRATNTWDFPTYLLLGLAGVLMYNWRRSRGLSQGMLGRTAFQGAMLVAMSVLLFLPFTQNYGVAYTSFSRWQGSYTSAGDYLLVHGLFLFIIVTYMALESRRWTAGWSEATLFGWRRYVWPVMLGLAGTVGIMFVLLRQGYLVGPMALALALVAALLALRPKLPPARRVPLALVAVSLALTLMVEIIVLDGDVGRMNTVFKFYLQVWVLLSIVAGVAFVDVWPLLSRRRRSALLWRVALAMLVAIAILYPILAVRAKWAVRMSDEAPFTLDGMAFMQTTSYGDTALDGSSQTIHLADDYEAIQWMWRNIVGSPVIAEAHSLNPYRTAANRVAMYTGLPAIIGWDSHQRQQRAALPGSLVTTRRDDVTRLYNTTDIGEALAILDRYDVRYIYAGQLEWIYYRPQGLLKFQTMADRGLLVEVYRSGSVSIYEVTGS